MLIVKSCGSSKSSTVDTSVSDTAITDISGSTSDTVPTDTTPVVTDPQPSTENDPIGVYTFSSKTGCRTWWDLFHSVYGLDIESESDPRVTTILTYNGLDASFKPTDGAQVKLPPAAMINSTTPATPEA